MPSEFKNTSGPWLTSPVNQSGIIGENLHLGFLLP